MNCEEFQSGLARAIDERAAIPASVREHGRDCQQAECRQSWTEYRLLDDAISQWRRMPHQVDFVNQILERADVIPPPVGVARGKNLFNGFGKIASGLPGGLVVASLAAVLTWSAYFGSSPKLSSTQPDVAENVASSGAAAELDVGYQQLGSLYVDWVAGAASGLTGSVASAISPAESTDASSDSKSSGDWIQTWEQRLRPFGEEVRRTIGPLAPDESGDQTHLAPVAGSDLT